MDGGTSAAPSQPALAASVVQGLSVTGARSALSLMSRVTGSLGLAREDISVSDICTAATWESPHTFIRFYHLDCAVIGTLSP